MNRFSLAVILGLLTVCPWISGCSKTVEDPNRLPTVPVTGVIHVDGAPVAMLKVMAHDKAEIARTVVPSSCYTTSDGKFALSTYESGDGLPAGEYSLTFQYGVYAIIGNQYTGDKFKGKYSKKGDSKFTFTVKEGEPVDMGTIELTTSK